MKNLLICGVVAALTVATTATAEAKHHKKHKHYHDGDVVYAERNPYYYQRGYDRGYDGRYGRGPTRSIYIIERNRPVERMVYVDSGGRYFRWVDGDRVYVRGRYFDSYPSRYYYRDGRPRIGVSFSL